LIEQEPRCEAGFFAFGMNRFVFRAIRICSEILMGLGDWRFEVHQDRKADPDGTV
jgi:hypothetical protein